VTVAQLKHNSVHFEPPFRRQTELVPATSIIPLGIETRGTSPRVTAVLAEYRAVALSPDDRTLVEGVMWVIFSVLLVVFVVWPSAGRKR
jgi:hypothetical protein